MTLRKWITFASAAALIATSACSDKGGSKTSTGQSPAGDSSATSQGRRADMPSRARADGGTSDLNSGTSATSTPSAPAPTDSTSSGTSGTDTKK
jgi:hypothetical protein